MRSPSSVRSFPARTLEHVHRWLAGLAVLALLDSAVFAQINVNGGPQGIVWTPDCTGTQLFKNNTGLALAGLWVGINNDGVNNAPEIAEVSVHDQAAGRTWDVDDNEDFDNDDGGENNETDATPTGLASGWHRVQARANADVLAVGENFTVKLCDSAAGSLAGRTIFLIPIAPQAGQTGGDQGMRTELPLGIGRFTPSGSVTIVAAGAPPGSTSFSIAANNVDGGLGFRKLTILPPPGVTVVNATASGGGVYEAPTRTIIWPTPIPPGTGVQVNVTVNGIARSLITTIAFDASLKVSEKP